MRLIATSVGNAVFGVFALVLATNFILLILVTSRRTSISADSDVELRFSQWRRTIILSLAVFLCLSLALKAFGIDIAFGWASWISISVLGLWVCLFVAELFTRLMALVRRRQTEPPPAPASTVGTLDQVPVQEPGWGRSLSMFANMVPIWGPWRLLRERPGHAAGLTALRFMFMVFVTGLLLFLLLLSFIAPWNGYGSSSFLLLVAGWGIASLWLVQRAHNRPLSTESSAKLAESYRDNFFKGVAFAESTALMAFFGVFVTNKLWVYLVGLAPALIGLALVAPTRRDIEQRQQQLTAQGSRLSLLEALASQHGGAGRGA